MFWVDSAVAQYQTWEDTAAGYGVYYKQKLLEVLGARNDITPTDDGPQVTLSLFNGRFTIPGFSSPTVRISKHYFNRSLVLFGKTMSSWPAYRIVDEEGKRTEYFDLMLAHIGNTSKGVAVTKPLPAR